MHKLQLYKIQQQEELISVSALNTNQPLSLSDNLTSFKTELQKERERIRRQVYSCVT